MAIQLLLRERKQVSCLLKSVHVGFSPASQLPAVSVLWDSASFSILLDWSSVHVYVQCSSNTVNLGSVSRHKLRNSITFIVNCIYLPAFSFVCPSGTNCVKFVCYRVCLLSP